MNPDPSFIAPACPTDYLCQWTATPNFPQKPYPNNANAGNSFHCCRRLCCHFPSYRGIPKTEGPMKIAPLKCDSCNRLIVIGMKTQFVFLSDGTRLVVHSICINNVKDHHELDAERPIDRDSNSSSDLPGVGRHADAISLPSTEAKS